jgi:hypothetical protein
MKQIQLGLNGLVLGVCAYSLIFKGYNPFPVVIMFLTGFSAILTIVADPYK